MYDCRNILTTYTKIIRSGEVRIGNLRCSQPSVYCCAIPLPVKLRSYAISVASRPISSSFAFGIGSAMAATAGILSAMDTNMTPTFGFNLLLWTAHVERRLHHPHRVPHPEAAGL